MHADSMTSLQWLNAHPNLSGLATFIISAAESIAIIGTIIPGTVIMIAIGTLAGANVIPLWSTIIYAILGAIVGDRISYMTGYYFKNRLRSMWPFKQWPGLIGSGENFFHKHGAMSVFIGRFVGPVRALVPLVAGMLRMKRGRFTLVSICSAIGWAPTYMLPGIIIGAASLELPPDIAVHVVLKLLFTGLFIIFCIWLIYKTLTLIQKQLNQLLNRLWDYFRHSPYLHVISTSLKHYDHSQTHGQLTLAFYFLLTTFIFLLLACFVHIEHSNHITINIAFLYLFRSLRNPVTDQIMIFMTLFGEKKLLIPFLLIIFSFLAWHKRWHTAWHCLALLALTIFVSSVIKHTVQSIRPWGNFLTPYGFSFPSGHTTLSTTFYVALAMLLLKFSRLRCQWLVYLPLTLFLFAIGMSRVYLNAHWFTDVLGGWLLSAALLMLITISYNRKKESSLPVFKLFFTAYITLTLLVIGDYVLEHNKLQKNYSLLPWPTYTTSLDNWWNSKGEHLPLFRIGRMGIPTQMLNIQWVGNLNDIEKVLRENHWESPEPSSLINVLRRVSDIESAEHLPLVSPLYFDKKPVLVLIKHHNGEKKLFVLRLWKSQLNLTNSSEPLWVGSIGVTPSTYSWLFNHKNYLITFDDSLLFENPVSHYEIKYVKVNVTLHHKQKVEQLIFLKPNKYLEHQ